MFSPDGAIAREHTRLTADAGQRDAAPYPKFELHAESREQRLERLGRSVVYLTGWNDVMKPVFPNSDEEVADIERVQEVGTGFVTSVEGQTMTIMTNAHVAAVFKRVSVNFESKVYSRGLEATLRHIDFERDLALFTVTIPDGDLPPAEALTFGDSDEVKPGQQVDTISYPLTNTQAMGQVPGHAEVVVLGIDDKQHTNHEDKDFIGVLRRGFKMQGVGTAAGSSGAPVLNEKGEVVGIHMGGLRDPGNARFAVAIHGNEARTLAKHSKTFIAINEALKDIIAGREEHPKDEAIEALPVSFDSALAAIRSILTAHAPGREAELAQEIFVTDQSQYLRRTLKAGLLKRAQKLRMYNDAFRAGMYGIDLYSPDELPQEPEPVVK